MQGILALTYALKATYRRTYDPVFGSQENELSRRGVKQKVHFLFFERKHTFGHFSLKPHTDLVCFYDQQTILHSKTKWACKIYLTVYKNKTEKAQMCTIK